MRDVKSFTAVYLHRDPVDMRKGIPGLSDIVQLANMGQLNGNHLFVFCGRRRNSIKILYFDRSGFALWQKKLEADRFPWPRRLTEEVVELKPEQMAWLLDGIDVWKLKPFSEFNFEKVC
jgi:transposase